jgi:hypothetical protein
MTAKAADKSENCTHLHSEKSGANLGGSKRKTHVTRVSGSDGVHGKPTSLVGGSGKGSLGVDIHSSTAKGRSLQSQINNK